MVTPRWVAITLPILAAVGLGRCGEESPLDVRPWPIVAEEMRVEALDLRFADKLEVWSDEIRRDYLASAARAAPGTQVSAWEKSWRAKWVIRMCCANRELEADAEAMRRFLAEPDAWKAVTGVDCRPLPPPPPWPELSAEQKADAERLGVPATLENDLGMRFVLVPAGSFVMGSPRGEPGRHAGEIQHEVRITRSFYVQMTEVTEAQYRPYRPIEGHLETRDPVVHVSWAMAAGFARWASRRDPSRSYHLPTEAQWEYACRAGTKTACVWGDVMEEGWRYANARGPGEEEGDAWPLADGHSYLARVGSYPANAWGLHDMHGNVWEWCHDWYGRYPEHAVTDPTGPTTVEARVIKRPKGRNWRPRHSRWRVLRGGSFFQSPYYVRSAFRLGSDPNDRDFHIGFRLVSPVVER